MLLTDDNAINRQVIKLFLAPQGCDISEATNGKEALDLIAQAKSRCEDAFRQEVLLAIVLLGLLHFFWMRAAKQNFGEWTVYTYSDPERAESAGVKCRELPGQRIEVQWARAVKLATADHAA